MDLKVIKRNISISALLLIMTSAVFFSRIKTEQIRLVDFLSILVLGILIGVLIANLALYLRFKFKKNGN